MENRPSYLCICVITHIRDSNCQKGSIGWPYVESRRPWLWQWFVCSLKLTHHHSDDSCTGQPPYASSGRSTRPVASEHSTSSASAPLKSLTYLLINYSSFLSICHHLRTRITLCCLLRIMCLCISVSFNWRWKKLKTDLLLTHVVLYGCIWILWLRVRISASMTPVRLARRELIMFTFLHVQIQTSSSVFREKTIIILDFGRPVRLFMSP